MGDNLRESCLMTLPLALHRQTQLRFAGRVYTQFNAIGHT